MLLQGDSMRLITKLIIKDIKYIVLTYPTDDGFYRLGIQIHMKDKPPQLFIGDLYSTLAEALFYHSQEILKLRTIGM